MSVAEGPGSAPEALLDLEITRLEVILVPSRVEAPSAGTENARIVDRLDPIHYDHDIRGPIRDPVVRVRPDAGDVADPGLYAPRAMFNCDVASRHRGGARRAGKRRGRRRYRLGPCTARGTD